MRRCLLFVCVLLIQGEAFSENFGPFKKSWNVISINKQVSVRDDNREPDPVHIPEVYNSDGRRDFAEEVRLAGEHRIKNQPTVDVLVHSVSFKLINVESKDWKAALQGKKIRHCAVKVDADLRKMSKLDKYGDIILSFFDKDGLLVRPAWIRNGKIVREYWDSVSIPLSTIKAGAPQKVLFMPDASCGPPVRVKLNMKVEVITDK